MDNKKEFKDRIKYQHLKNKFHNKTLKNASKGTKSEIKFFENERCLEIWFLFYFKNTSAQFLTQNELIKEVNKHCVYKKTEKFFLSTKGLHQYFTKNGGDLNIAKINAKKSITRRNEQNIDYTYSEMNEFFDLVEKKECE